jgi:hypothetical protein
VLMHSGIGCMWGVAGPLFSSGLVSAEYPVSF